MDISITLNEQQQELLLSQARVQGIFDLDDDLWAEIAAKIKAARIDPWDRFEPPTPEQGNLRRTARQLMEDEQEEGAAKEVFGESL